MSARLGRKPASASPESEVLRRFRSFTVLTLSGGQPEPSLDGVRAPYPRVARVLGAWVEAAIETAGPSGPLVRESLDPLRERFQTALRGTATARRASGAPRNNQRRAVAAAIDRVADAFLAVDTDTGTIEDANPAAGALLGTPRDVLLGSEAVGYVPKEEHGAWWTELEAVSEGDDGRHFRTSLSDGLGGSVAVEASVTRFSTRRRTLALFVARPTRAAGR
jgi:PAS domain-containing protein